MKIKMLRSCMCKGKKLMDGESFDVSDADAKYLIASNAAETVKSAPAPKAKAK